MERDDENGHMETGDVKMKMAYLTGYYVFNHRRFSYPAAFTQSYIQRRSAGSWLAGLTLTMNNSVFNSDVKINQNRWRARAVLGMRL